MHQLTTAACMTYNQSPSFLDFVGHYWEYAIAEYMQAAENIRLNGGPHALVVIHYNRGIGRFLKVGRLWAW